MPPKASFPYRLYLVTDQQACLGRDFFYVVEEAVKGGVDLVQIREKLLDAEAFYAKAARLKELLDRYAVPLIINDYVPLAARLPAAGVHIGQTDTPFAQARAQLAAHQLIGLSLENLSQVTTPEAAQADYLALSPIYATPTKTDTLTEWGLPGIRQVSSLTDRPLVAIGGIHAHNAAAIVDSGADCLAVVSAICSASQPGKAAETLRHIIEKHTNS